MFESTPSIPLIDRLSHRREVTIYNPPKRNPDRQERKRVRQAETFASRLSEGFKLLSAHR